MKISLKSIFTGPNIERVAAFPLKNCTGGFLAIVDVSSGGLRGGFSDLHDTCRQSHRNICFSHVACPIPYSVSTNGCKFNPS